MKNKKILITLYSKGSKINNITIKSFRQSILGRNYYDCICSCGKEFIAQEFDIKNYMDKSEILRRVEVIFSKELENNDLILTYETTNNDVEGWDSRSHGQLVVAMQEDFGIEFELFEIISWENLNDIIESIQKKI